MKAQVINTRVIGMQTASPTANTTANTTARTQATARPGSVPTLAAGLLAQARGLEILALLASRMAVALIPALAIVVAAALAAANPDTAVYLQATLWAGGFLYLALAVESDKSGGAALNLGLGLAVQVLAWLSVQVAPELAVAAAVLVAARVAVAIFRRT
jgi:apolipoprotein N-acyltransferase